MEKMNPGLDNMENKETNPTKDVPVKQAEITSVGLKVKTHLKAGWDPGTVPPGYHQ
jgi:hypothetical protein